MYKKLYEWKQNQFKPAQMAFEEVILTGLGLEVMGGRDIVKPLPEGLSYQEKVDARQEQGKVGTVSYSASAYEPGNLPFVVISVHLYDDEYEERFETLVPVLEKRCQRGDFGDKLEPDVRLLVHKG